MDISCYHNKLRKDFGCHLELEDSGPSIHVDLISNHNVLDNYIRLPSVEVGCLCSSEKSAHEVNTLQFPVESRGMNHKEGGWPGDVDHRDEDQVARFKKKIEKDENYTKIVMKLGELMERYVMENNALDIYEEYFCDEAIEDDEIPTKIMNVFRDYNIDQRVVSSISLSPDSPSRLAVAYSCKQKQNNAKNICMDSYVWDADNTNQPFCTLKSESFLSCIEYCFRDANSVAGGCENGLVVLYDIRKGGTPDAFTAFSHSHQAPVYDIKWINSKGGTEFMSASTDGKIISWDARNLSKPTQVFILDPEKVEEGKEIPLLNRKYGITCLEYEPSLPYKFMIGTEQGTVFSCNRRPKFPGDVISALFQTEMGPLFSVDRNPYFPKHFATISALAVMVWCEENKELPLLSLMSNDGYITDGLWSPSRPSVLFLTKTTGDFEIWDLLAKHNEPTLSIKLENESLNCICCNDVGDNIACGTLNGSVHLLGLGRSFQTINKHEKTVLASMFDREGKRGKFLQGKTREQRLKKFAEQQEIETLARRKLLEVNDINFVVESGDEMYEIYEELEDQFIDKGDMKRIENEMENQLDVLTGRSNFLEKIGKEAPVSRALRYVFDVVAVKAESDNSRFPYKEAQVSEEYGEEKFVQELACSYTLEKLLRSASDHPLQ